MRKVQAIAYIYWRRIKAGTRTYDKVPAQVREDVKLVAQTEVAQGVITADEYQEWVGEAYPDTPIVDGEEASDAK